MLAACDRKARGGPMSDIENGIAARIRDILARRHADNPFITYQALASALRLSPPGTIHKVAGALEQLMREDVAAGRPMIAALVISRAGNMPRRRFFDLRDNTQKRPRHHPFHPQDRESLAPTGRLRRRFAS